MGFIPSVFYKDPLAAVAWLERAFGFQTAMLIEPPGNDPTTMHAEMTLGDAGRVMVGAEWSEWARSPASVGGANTCSVHVDLEKDIDAHCEQARVAGATIEMEPADQFFGARTYRARDIEGHVWTFAQKIREVTREEAERVTGYKITGWV